MQTCFNQQDDNALYYSVKTRMKIVPMNKEFVLYRCLHGGLLSPSNIEQKSRHVPGLPEEQINRNRLFLTRLIDTYGSCAMLAMDGDMVVGHVRFYPDIICELLGTRDICCQDPGAAITEGMVDMAMPQMESISDPKIMIHCWLIHKEYRYRGISHLLLQGMLRWAQKHGWQAVRASAAVNDPWVASQACTLMLRTYEKHGFKKYETVPSVQLKDYLTQLLEGKFGAERQKESRMILAGRSLSEMAVYHKVEHRLQAPE